MAGKHRKRGKKSERKLRSLSESLKTDSKLNFVNEKARRRNPKDSEVLNAEATRIPEVGQDSKYQFVRSGCNPRDQRNVVLHDHVPNKKVEEIITRQISYRTVYNRNDSRSANGDSISHLIQQVDYLKNQVNRLTQENLQLYNALQNAQSRIPPDDSNDVAVIIRNKCLEEKYLPVLTEFVEAVINGRISVEDVYQFCNSHKNIDQEVRDSRNTPEGDLFSLDISAISEPNTSSFVPRYETSFGEILQDGQQNDKDSDNRCETRVSKSCFNCSESHHLNECPYKIDVRRVINARKRAKAHWVPSVRYHVHGKKETGFKPGVLSEELMEALRLQKNEVPMFIYRMRVLDYPPGWLQEAAVESSGITLYGLDGNVEKDENCADGVNTSLKVQYDPDKLIDFPGFNVPLPPDVADEAHLFGLPPIQEHHLRCVQEQYMSKPDVVPCRKRKLQFSSSGGPSKIQRFEEDMEVEGDLDGGILEDDGDSSAQFIPPLPKDPLPPPPPEDPLFLPPPSPPYEVLSPSFQPEDISLSPDDSELCLNEELIQDNSDSYESTVPLISGSNTFSSSVKRFALEMCEEPFSDTSSPSLTELEELKKRLVLELGMSSDPPNANGARTVHDDDTVITVNAAQPESSVVESSECSNEAFVTLESSNDLSNFSESSVNDGEIQTGPNKLSDSPELLQSTQSKSKLVSLGTPSLSRHSSFTKLPDYDKFSKDVTSHLNFENLPNSTGTYQKMKGVLKKVKEKLNSLMQ